jgi:G:T-mismatch repair DNA endonuclease (very short patch repair protein)
MINLKNEDRQQLIALLKDIPELSNERSRRQFLTEAGLTPLLQRLDLSGSPFIAISEIITKLSNYGRLNDDREALGLFLNGLKIFDAVGVQQQQFIDRLLTDYEMMTPIAELSAVGRWRGQENPVNNENHSLADSQVNDKLCLNLLPLFLPKKIYVSDLIVNRDEIIKNSTNYKLKLQKNASARDVVRSALEQAGFAFGVDWVCHEGKLVTFYDLTKDDLPLTAIIDRSTTTVLNSQDFYEIDDNKDKVFKSLLCRCLQQKLYHQQVVWQYQEKLFIFVEVDGAAIRKEEWYSNKKETRMVYKRLMKDNKPNEILYCKHFAFRTRYRRFGKNWYLVIIPDWFFSFDGYRRSFYAKDKLDWLKRHEHDKNIYNHLRFITAFLKTEKPSDLFIKRASYPFLKFGELITFDNAPSLDDDAWNPKTSKNDSVNTDNWQQMELPLDI